MACPLCERVENTKNHLYPYLVHEFKYSYLYLGEHQYYRGYCVLVTKGHFKEMTDIPSGVREEVFQEMMKVHQLIEKVYQPHKMNMCSLGNVVSHVHWHFFPRYAEDENFKNPPWLQMHLFDSAKVTPGEREKLIKKLQEAMASL
jgi:diadenosine tetraphosphate (Ap4A) HIT family hydrolase